MWRNHVLGNQEKNLHYPEYSNLKVQDKINIKEINNFESINICALAITFDNV